MTENITPTNINCWNMTKNVRQQLTITGEYDRIQNNKFILRNFFFFGHIHRFLGQVQWLMFVGVICRSRSNVHVRRCEFHLIIFKPNFGHIESIKIASLICYVVVYIKSVCIFHLFVLSRKINLFHLNTQTQKCVPKNIKLWVLSNNLLSRPCLRGHSMIL